MKSWIISYVGHEGLPSELQMLKDAQPTKEEAALEIRALEAPVLEKVDLNDFVNREEEPTVKYLEQQGVKILSIEESLV